MIRSNPDFVHKYKLSNHNETKKLVLDFVDNYQEVNRQPRSDITKQSLVDGTNGDLDEIFKSLINQPLSNLALDLGMNRFAWNFVGESWFHQYEDNSSDVWHTHPGQLVALYYAELPYGNQNTTVFLNPNDQKVYQVDAEEGDVVFFPTYISHRSLPNTTGQRKTILSANINIGGNCDFDKIDALIENNSVL
jgi:hypothetical protein